MLNSFNGASAASVPNALTSLAFILTTPSAVDLTASIINFICGYKYTTDHSAES
jgi:hypothetical protein